MFRRRPAGHLTADEAGTLDAYDRLLARYVPPDGVRYAAWRIKPEDLTRLEENVKLAHR